MLEKMEKQIIENVNMKDLLEERVKLREIVIASETAKLELLEATGLKLMECCRNDINGTSIANMFAPEENDVEPYFNMRTTQLLKEVYLYANELFATLHFLGSDEDLIYFKTIGKNSDGFYGEIKELGKYKRNICMGNYRHINAVKNNLIYIGILMYQVNDLKGEYFNWTDYADVVDVSLEKNAVDIIENFQDLMKDIIEKLKPYIKLYLSPFDGFERLVESIKNTKPFNRYFYYQNRAEEGEED